MSQRLPRQSGQNPRPSHVGHGTLSASGTACSNNAKPPTIRSATGRAEAGTYDGRMASRRTSSPFMSVSTMLVASPRPVVSFFGGSRCRTFSPRKTRPSSGFQDTSILLMLCGYGLNRHIYHSITSNSTSWATKNGRPPRQGEASGNEKRAQRRLARPGGPTKGSKSGVRALLVPARTGIRCCGHRRRERFRALPVRARF